MTKLADGQVPGETIVASTDEIRTVKEFEAKNWYVSFAFALDSLSLFKKD